MGFTEDGFDGQLRRRTTTMADYNGLQRHDIISDDTVKQR